MIRIFMILLVSSLVITRVFAAEQKEEFEPKIIVDQEWIDITKKSLNTALKSIYSKYKELVQLKKKAGNYDDNENILSLDEYGEVNLNNVQMRIFISSSMSIELLKYYQKHARAYGGYLVMNGLPENSWKKLFTLMHQLCDLKGSESFEGSNCGVLIDSEWFDEFDIKSVPSFVLSKSEGITGDMVTFDKVSGNIGIKRALEIMADKGELKYEARKWLGK